MTPELVRGGLRKAEWWEYAVRFVFGGAITAGAGLVAARWGPEIGGLFLAFPAILPASLTLVKRHDGRAMAADDARGACLGSIGLAAFALVVWRTIGAWNVVLVLLLASVAWTITSVGVWIVWYGRRRTKHAAPPRRRRHPVRRRAKA